VQENTEELLALLNRSAHRVVDAAFITLFLIDDVKRELFSSISKVPSVASSASGHTGYL
jgi:hypothetical protein